jgi:hypothetical protein
MPETKCLDASADALGDNRYVFVLAIAEDHRKFFTAVACDDISIPRLGFGSSELRELVPRLMTCDISGYGEAGQLRELKA